MTTASSPPTLDEGARGDTRALDRQIVERIAVRDEQALREAYDLYAGFVNGVALGILKDRDLAADITQEVFVRLYERFER